MAYESSITTTTFIRTVNMDILKDNLGITSDNLLYTSKKLGTGIKPTLTNYISIDISDNIIVDYTIDTDTLISIFGSANVDTNEGITDIKIKGEDVIITSQIVVTL